jgi:two-component system, cell cycle response regulator CpdR
VTDINLLGKLDGWEVGRSAREIDPTMPIIYMTGTHREEWAAKGVPNSLLLAKPFAPAQIVTAISQLLNATRRSRPQSSEPGLMARTLKTYQTSLSFFDRAIAAERAVLEKRSKGENARWEKQKYKLDLAVRQPK